MTAIYTARQLDEPVCLASDEVLTALRVGAVDTEHGVMRFGSNYTFLVTIRHAETEFLAIYKPRVGEAPLWDFATGTLCQRETAAYLLSEWLGWDIVPPTILREDAPRGIGSLQAFINHDPARHYYTFDEQHLEQIKRIMLFDVIVNNADRKGGHTILDESDHVWGIDHGLCFNHVPKLRTVMWEFGREAEIIIAGSEVAPALLTDMQRVCDALDNPDESLGIALDALLDPQEMTALSRRITRVLSTRRYPAPGLGNSRPWPAV